RDRTVTGVQTCALPIYRLGWRRERMFVRSRYGREGSAGPGFRRGAAGADVAQEEGHRLDGAIFRRGCGRFCGDRRIRRARLCQRSEERRVGKEGWCWGV